MPVKVNTFEFFYTKPCKDPEKRLEEENKCFEREINDDLRANPNYRFISATQVVRDANRTTYHVFYEVTNA